MSELLVKFSDYIKLNNFSDVYKNPTAIFFAYCESNKINYATITFEQLSVFIVQLLEDNYNKGYVNNFIKAIKFLYRFLADYRIVEDARVLEDVKRLKLLKIETFIKTGRSLQEVDALITNTINFGAPVDAFKIKAMMYFLFFTGIRRQEFLNFKRKDIDLKKKFAIVRVPTKNKKERKVYFPKLVADILEQFFAGEAEETNAFNFTHHQLKHFFEFIKNFDSQFTMHTLRRSFGIHLLRKGVNLRTIQKLYGHSNIQTTMNYLNVSDEMEEEIYRSKIG